MTDKHGNKLMRGDVLVNEADLGLTGDVLELSDDVEEKMKFVWHSRITDGILYYTQQLLLASNWVKKP